MDGCSIEEMAETSRITGVFLFQAKTKFIVKHKTLCLFTATRTHIEQTPNLKVCTACVQHRKTSLQPTQMFYIKRL